MNRTATWLLLPLCLSLAACSPEQGPAQPGAANQGNTPSTAAQANVAAGLATDAQGKPLTDVTVVVDG